MDSDKPDLGQLDSPALAGPYSTAVSPCSIPQDFPSYTQAISLDSLNEHLLEKSERNWDKAPSIASCSPSPSRLETPLIVPELDEAHYIESARHQAKLAAHNIDVLGGNSRDSRALINSETYWETEALYYTALLHEHLPQVTDVAVYWQQEARRQKEALARWLPLLKYDANDRPRDVGALRHRSEEAGSTPENREALYYRAVVREHLAEAVDVVTYWKEEAAHQREALARWVPSFKDSADSLRYNINQFEYWQEESVFLTDITDEMV